MRFLSEPFMCQVVAVNCGSKISKSEECRVAISQAAIWMTFPKRRLKASGGLRSILTAG